MPRAGLSADVVVAEAATLVDDVGREGLTLAELANRFGVAAPSLYKHVNGIDHLQRLLARKVIREVGTTLRQAATGKEGPTALRAVANAYRGYALAHPGRYAYILRAPDAEDDDPTAAATEIVSVLYDIFAGFGIRDDDSLDAVRFVRSTLHGFVSLELVDGFKMAGSVDHSFERLVSATGQALAGW